MTDTAQATATVTITLPREDLEDIDAALRRSIYLWNDRNEALRVTDAFREACRAALAAAPPPAPSELEQAIAECEASFDFWELKHNKRDQDWNDHGEPNVFLEAAAPFVARVVDLGYGTYGHGSTESEALQDAIAKSRLRTDIAERRRTARLIPLSDSEHAERTAAQEQEMKRRQAERAAERDDDEYDDEE